MPNRPSRECKKPGCHNLTNDINGYCSQHQGWEQRERDKRRLPAHERGYDNSWHKIRNYKIKINPLCERCQAAGNHHKDHNPKNNEWDNLESLCQACHDAEHKADRWGSG